MYRQDSRHYLNFHSQSDHPHKLTWDSMAEVILASEASNDETQSVEPQHDYTDSGRNDSVIGPLPTEGYRIFDTRPTVEYIIDTVSR
jgi:hypothetical protein